MFQDSEYENIPLSFYQGDDVVEISRLLVGKYLFHQNNEGLTGGRIVETEAYNGRSDRACHAYHKRTPRTEVMYQLGGRAYVYLCYGMHHLFNIVTNRGGFADAVLIRALEPIEGIEIMRDRTNKRKGESKLASGPGLVGKAMGFTVDQTGTNLDGDIWVARRKSDKEVEIAARERIGVDYAGEDAKLPWRFIEVGNDFVSKK